MQKDIYTSIAKKKPGIKHKHAINPRPVKKFQNYLLKSMAASLS